VSAAEYRITIASRVQRWIGGSPETYSAILIGIDPSHPPMVNKLEMTSGDGTFFTGNGSGTALLEKGFALKYSLGPGSSISVRTLAGYVNVTLVARAFSPEYIFQPINPQSVIPLPGTLAVVYLPIDWLRAAFGLGASYVNEFTILFNSGADSGTVQERIDQQLASSVILYSIPKDQNYGYALIKEDLSSGNDFSGVLAFIILLVAFFVVYASFTRIVQEQRREIGVLRALGYSRRAVLGSYLYMALLMGLIGSIIGLIIGIPIGQAFANFYADMVVHTNATVFEIPVEVAVAGILFGPLTACLACGIAVWGTVSMEPQTAIKGLYHKTAKSRHPRKERHKGPAGRSRLSYMTLYSFRDMARHKSRSAITAGAVAFAVVLGSLTFLLIASFNNSIDASVQENEHWDLVVDFATPLNTTKAASVTAPGITDTVLISKVATRWHFGGSTGTAIVIGMDANQTLHSYIIENGRVARGDAEVMVGYITAKDNHISIGDKILVETMAGSKDLTVTAIVDDMIGNLFVDAPVINAIAGQALFGGMYVKTANGATAQVQDALLNDPNVGDVMLKSNVRSYFSDMMSSYSTLLYVFALFGITIAAVTIANIVFVGVLERFGEYGQLRAIGYSKRQVSQSIYMEILVTITLGSIVAIPLLLVLMEALVPVYKDFYPVYQTRISIGDWAGYFAVVFMTFLFGLLAAVPGIRYVSKMDIAKTVSGGQFG